MENLSLVTAHTRLIQRRALNAKRNIWVLACVVTSPRLIASWHPFPYRKRVNSLDTHTPLALISWRARRHFYL